MAKFILAAGGTGGHIFPALAVAEKLIADGHEALLYTDKRGVPMIEGKIDYQLIISASPFAGGIIKRFLGMALLGIGLVQSILYILLARPKAIMGFGGYPSFAPVFAAKLLRKPCYLHEQNAVMGRANRLLARQCKRTALSFVTTKNLPDEVNSITTGLPVRAPFFATKSYKADNDKLHLVIIGGSLGARIFAQIIPEAARLLDDDIKAKLHITQQARPEQIAELREAYANANIKADISSFYHDVASLYDECDLIISRSGASSVSEIAASGRASILVPFAHALDDHQTGNAQILESAGAAILISEPDFTAQKLNEVLSQILSSAKSRKDMAQKARLVARPDASQMIAALLVPPSTGVSS